MKTFNLNNNIKVKPTLKGLALIRSSGYVIKPEFDKDGYIEIQGWIFIAIFGPHTTWGNNEFEMNILIKDKDLK